jgi:endonuclease/exonuclease/phosphatase (EEP) superfamily protein YafD
VTVDLPPVPPRFEAPATETAARTPTGSVPPRLARLASHHPLVIATIIVTVALTLGTVAATLVAYAAPVWWVFDILTSYRPQYALILAVALVPLAILRCWRTLLIAVIALALNAAQVAPVFTDHQPAARAGSPTFTIAHLNLQSRKGNLVEMRRWLETNPADVFVLLHAGPGTIGGLRNGVGDYHMIYPVPIGFKHDGGIRYEPFSPETIVLTRRSGVTAAEPDDRQLPDASVLLTARLGGTVLHLLGTHTLSPGTAGRVAKRDQQLTGIANWLRGSPGASIAFGDFNVTYYSPSFKDLLHRSGGRSSQLGFGVQATWPHQFRPAGIAIDQSVYRGPITVIARQRGPSFGSEHRALLVTYALA